MVGSSNTLRKIGGKLAVNTCYVLTADVTKLLIMHLIDANLSHIQNKDKKLKL